MEKTPKNPNLKPKYIPYRYTNPVRSYSYMTSSKQP